MHPSILIKHRLILILSLIFAIVFVVGIAAINILIADRKKSLYELTEENGLEIELIKKNPNEGNLGFIYRSAIEEIMELDYITDCYKEGAPDLYDLCPRIVGDRTTSVSNNPEFIRLPIDEEDKFILVIENSEKFLSSTGSNIQITYTKYSGNDPFPKVWERRIGVDDFGYIGLPIIVPKYQYEEIEGYDKRGLYNLQKDISICFVDQYDPGLLHQGNVEKIIGYYDGTIYGKHPCLIPASSYTNFLKGWNLSNDYYIPYSVVRFTIDRSMNGQLDTVLDDINSIVSQDGAGTVEIEAVVNDEATLSIKNSLRLLQTINTAAMITAAIVAMVISILFTMRLIKYK